MSVKETLREDGISVRRYQRADGVEFVADFGPSSDGSVELIEGTAIVVVGDKQYDIDIEGDAQAFMNNGVLSIEVEE